MSPYIEVVIPTRNRSDLVVKKVLSLLEHPRVGEVIVVADGCTDDTVERLRGLDTDRVVVVPLAEHSGLPAARNAGIRRTCREWVLLTDDDDVLSDNFIDECLEVASAAQADVVGAPWLHLGAGEDVRGALARTPRRGPGPEIDRPSTFPASRWHTNIWFTPNMLISRRAAGLFFDESYRGNFYREDSDFIVRVARAGMNTVVAGNAYTYSDDRRAGGGIRRDTLNLRLRYEYWAVRNTVRFLLRHGTWLSKEGYGWPHALFMQFAIKRAGLLLGGRVGTLLGRSDL
ncbi:glycosyltransferase family 2 protein [Mycolicibacterium neoaurum]|uniref:Glycosyl transferase family protein n=1 Tax=Mycolicibacterium neoaurum TaxID=1795 RepID=A0AAV2WRM7_MYCNE|nr:glycosyltransferase family 2 protein [Mycolicibacterium neoaurum]TLH59057.1 hypothetical protein C1S81_13325 [Mycolicibacterium neoaurum]CDQ46941.1 glycosyl transferase family protein [Mycolicibacterium neoaurum]